MSMAKVAFRPGLLTSPECVRDCTECCNISFLIDNRGMNGKQIIARLKAAGWIMDRVNGSHHIMVKDGVAVPVPVHGGKDAGAGLLSTIARQTGVKLK